MRGIDILRLGGRRAAAPGDTEDLRPISTSGYVQSVIGAATPHAALFDASDSSYIQAGLFSYTTKGTPLWDMSISWNGDIQDTTFDFVSSVAIELRGTVGVGNSSFTATAAGFNVVTPAYAVWPAVPDTLMTATFIPSLTKFGGGNWTKAQFNALTWSFQAVSTTASPPSGNAYRAMYLIVRPTAG